MTYVYVVHEPALWPSHSEWFAILRGVSGHLGFDDRFMILQHLAHYVGKRRRMGLRDAREFVATRIAMHVEQLCVEFGLAPDYAYQLAARVYGWLRSLEDAPNVDLPAWWPTADTWLAIDRGASWQAAMDANLTLTSNLAFIAVSTGQWPARGAYATSAAHWVHDRIADHAGQLAKELGFWMLAPFLRARLRAALNGFDAPLQRAVA